MDKKRMQSSCAMLGYIWARSNENSPGASPRGYRRLATRRGMLLVYGELDTSSIVDVMWRQPFISFLMFVIVIKKIQGNTSILLSSPPSSTDSVVERIAMCVRTYFGAASDIFDS